MWSAVPIVLLCMSMLDEDEAGQRPQMGRSPVKHRGLSFVRPSVRLSVRPSPPEAWARPREAQARGAKAGTAALKGSRTFPSTHGEFSYPPSICPSVGPPPWALPENPRPGPRALRKSGRGCATPERVAQLRRALRHYRKGRSTPERVAPLQKGSLHSRGGHPTPEGVAQLRRGSRDSGRGCVT